MDATARKWMSPVLPSYTDGNATAITNTALSLTEYFNQTVGVWDNYTGTTNASGELTVAHGAPFTPRCVLITERHGTNAGSFHVDSVDRTNVVVHFLISSSGADRASTAVSFDMLCLP